MEIPLTIDKTQEQLIKRDFSCVDLVDSYLERINTFDSKINSFLTITKDVAYEKAKWCDKAISDFGENAFKSYPLLGVTVALKDLFLTEGIRTTAGSKLLENYIPQYSATVVKRLEEAGGIILGKTNCDAWAHGTSGENSDFAPTKNPWNYEYVPGGSSSGSAAALASNFCLISTGTDTGGSIRLPAAFSGTVGLKPTYGAVSRYGIIAMASSLDSIGHFTRTSTDSRKVFEITKGIDYSDATIVSNKMMFKNNKSLKIGLPEEYFAQGIDHEVKKSVFSAAEVFKRRGFVVQPINLPHTKYAISVYYIIQPAEVSSNLSRYDGIRYGSARDSFSSEAKRRIMLGTYVLSTGYYDKYYLKAMKVRTKIIEDFKKAFAGVDVILAPVSPTPAFKIGEKSDDPLKMYLADIFTVSANVAGIPGLTIPNGFNKIGLPLAFQLIGPAYSEELLFMLGEIFEKETKSVPNTAKLS